MQGDKNYGCKETRTMGVRRQGLWMQRDKDGCMEKRTLVDAMIERLVDAMIDSSGCNDRKTRGCNDRL